MKYRPILFSTYMVQAIIDGRKTQTRRVLKSQPILKNGLWQLNGAGWSGDSVTPVVGHFLYYASKYQPSDVIWVRETWQYSDDLEHPYLYKQKYEAEHLPECHDNMKWKPSIFMPKDAARLFLKVKGIRVERLQSISHDDAMDEGVKRIVGNQEDPFHVCYYFYPCNDLRDDSYLGSATTSFYSLWRMLHGKKHWKHGEESWKSNPWVWVIEFERIDKPDGFC